MTLQSLFAPHTGREQGPDVVPRSRIGPRARPPNPSGQCSGHGPLQGRGQVGIVRLASHYFLFYIFIVAYGLVAKVRFVS